MGAALDVLKVLYEPTAVYERVREKPAFLAPFVVLAIVLAICVYLMIPYQQAAVAEKLAQIAQQNPQAAAAAQNAQKFAIVGVVVGPIVFAIVLLLVAAVLWVLVSVFGGEGKFSVLLSVTTYAAVPGLLLQIAGLAVLMMKGVSSVSSPDDLQPALGLDLIAPGATGFMLAVLRGINPFSVWGAFLTATGVAVTHKTSKGTAWTVAIILLVLGVLLRAVASGFSNR
jgi:membrane protein, antimicrobial resistance system